MDINVEWRTELAVMVLGSLFPKVMARITEINRPQIRAERVIVSQMVISIVDSASKVDVAGDRKWGDGCAQVA